MKSISASVALIVIVGLVAIGSALPARKTMAYFQPAAPSYYGAPQRIMYMQYVQPGRTHARSTQAASALVAGESVATGTYLKDCDHVEADVAASGPLAVDIAAEESQNDEDVIGAAGAHVASSVAEAYPQEEESVPSVQVDIEQNVEASQSDDAAVDLPSEVAVSVDIPAAVDVPSDDAAKVPRDYNFEADVAAADTPVPAEAVPAASAPEADLPAPAPIAPVATPVNRYLPANKKVIIELEQSAEEDDSAVVEDEDAENTVSDDVDEADEADAAPVVPVAPKNPVRVPNARRPSVKRPVKAGSGSGARPTKPAKPLPVGTFFPIDFGGTAGGAIAIANSFSTGEGGAATSHAIAYGNGEQARQRARPSKYH